MSFKFEKILKHPDSGAIFDVNHKYSDKTFDELIIIRCIEQNKDRIAKDREFLLPFCNLYGTKAENSRLNTMKYLYREYCTTQCHDLSKINTGYVIRAIDLAFIYAE